VTGFVWCDGSTDPVVNVEVASIDYKVETAKILTSGNTIINKIEAINTSDTIQPVPPEMSYQESVTETSGWSNGVSIKVGTEVKFNAGIPMVGGAETTVSVEGSFEHTWNKSTSRQKTYTYTAAVVAPPHTAIVALVAIKETTIAVEYVIKGTAILTSGNRIPAQIPGLYVGTNSHDLTVTYVQRDPSTNKIVEKSQKITDVTTTIV